MKDLIFLTAIISIIYLLIYQITMPECIKINKLQVQYCTISTEENQNIICD